MTVGIPVFGTQALDARFSIFSYAAHDVGSETIRRSIHLEGIF